MTSSCHRSILQSLVLSLLLVLIHPSVVSQGLTLPQCRVSSPQSAFIYTTNGTGSTTVCPTVGAQDSILKINNSQSTYMTAGSPPVEVCTINELIIALTSTIFQRGSVEVIDMGSQATIIIKYAPPGYYVTDENLVLLVGERLDAFVVYGEPETDISVCKVVDGGGLMAINELSAIVLPVDDCQSPSTDSANVGQGRPNRISLSTTFASIIGTLNLVITKTDCTPGAVRLTEEFTLDVVNATPATTTQQTETTVTTTQEQPDDNTPTIIRAVVGMVFAVVVVVVVVVVVLVVTAYTCRHVSRGRRGSGGHVIGNGDSVMTTDGLSKPTPPLALVENGERINGDPPVTETSFSQGIDDDSGVESQGPSTPSKKNCIVVIFPNASHIWYTNLKRWLGHNFQVQVTNLFLPENPQEINAFEREVHQALIPEHVQNLFIIQDDEGSTPNYTEVLSQFIHFIESRPVDLYRLKVWLIKLRLRKTVQQHSTIHRLHIPYAPDQDGQSSQDCAEHIFGHVTQYKKSKNGAQPTGTNNHLSSHSLPPGEFSDGKDSPDAPSSWPISKRKDPENLKKDDLKVQLPTQNGSSSDEVAQAIRDMIPSLKQMAVNFQRTADNTERGVQIAQQTADSNNRIAESSERTAKSSEKTAENTGSLPGAAYTTAESAQKSEQTLHRIEEKIERAAQAAEDGAASTRQLVVQKQKKNFNEDSSSEEDA